MVTRFTVFTRAQLAGAGWLLPLLALVLACGIGAIPSRAADLAGANLADSGAPVLDYLDLNSVPAGAWVTVWGWNLGGEFWAAQLFLGETRIGKIAHWSNERIDFQIPPGAVSGDLTVRIYHQRSNPLPLTIHTGAILHVEPAAPNADDANPGTADAPWRTLARASQAAAGDLVYIHDGLYNETLAPQHSGNAAAPVAFKAWPGERPVLDGSGLPGTPDGILMDGWVVRGLSHVVVSGLTLRNFDQSIQLAQGVNNCGLFDLETLNSETGAVFYGAYDNRLARSRFAQNVKHGIEIVNYSSDLEILDCTVTSSTLAGVYADFTCEALNFTRVISEGNAGAGFELHSATTLLGESTARRNARGVEMAAGGTGQNLIVWDNAETGVRLAAGDSAATTTLVNCTIAASGGSGIEVETGVATRMSNLIVVGSAGPAVVFHDALEHGEIAASILQSNAPVGEPILIANADAEPALIIATSAAKGLAGLPSLQVIDNLEDLFEDYAGGNFKLAAASPARQSGVSDSAPLLDAQRRLRTPENGLVDAGAYAFDPGPPSAADRTWGFYE